MLLMKLLLKEVNTMDDLQFRRSIYADPNSQDQEFLDAIASDPAKQKFAQEIHQLDDKINQAMNVDVPDDLYNKLILRQTLASHQQQKRKKRIHLAMAASVAFAVGLTLNFMQFSSAYTTLGDYALAHVYHEDNYWHNSDEANVSLSSLNQKMAAFDGRFLTSVGKLISADYCRFDSMKSLHLVFQGKTSLVTVFVVPQNDDLRFDARFNDSNLQGRSEQFSKTNIIVIGDKNESLSQWQQTIRDNVQWST
jgi:hypothetical protein